MFIVFLGKDPMRGSIIHIGIIKNLVFSANRKPKCSIGGVRLCVGCS